MSEGSEPIPGGPLIITMSRTGPQARAGVLVATGVIAELGRRHPVEALVIETGLIVLLTTGHQTPSPRAELFEAELLELLTSRRFDGWTIDHIRAPLV